MTGPTPSSQPPLGYGRQWIDESDERALIATAARHQQVSEGQGLAEVPLTGAVDGAIVSGIVDRLLVTPAKVLVVDYKTNRAPAADAGSVPESYRRQMQTYARLLAGIYPGREIQTALLWTEAPRLDIVPVPQGVN